jgi:hypothetical protein
MEDVVENFIINLGDTDSSDGDNDNGTDTEGVESFMYVVVPL